MEMEELELQELGWSAESAHGGAEYHQRRSIEIVQSYY